MERLRSTSMSTQSCSTVSRGYSSIGPAIRSKSSPISRKRATASTTRAGREPASLE
jgi:hypothetical protein